MSSEQFPFGDCRTAVLTDIGSVQGVGVLVAVHAETQIIEYCSVNSSGLLDVEPADLLGRTGNDWLSARWPAVLSLRSEEGNQEWQDFSSHDPLVIAGHRSGSHFILEFERGRTLPQHWWSHSERTRFVQRLEAVQTVEGGCELLVKSVFEKGGYDHVMAYQFLDNWDGQVVFECCRPGVNGYLGLRFPATDIPPNARRLFTLNRQRMIGDVASAPSPILRASEGSEALDLTYSTLRSAHPAHIEYLKNMGVQASLTLSLVVRGKLWGLIACHHFSPRWMSIEDRTALGEMAGLVSLHLTNLIALADDHRQSEMRNQLARLQGAMSAADEVRPGLSLNLGIVREAFSAGGAWLRFEGEDFFSGNVPDKRVRAPLRDLLELFPREEISHYSALPPTLRPFRNLSETASGILFVPLNSADFIVLMRPEAVETVEWAGKPEAQLDRGFYDSHPLTPRNSFAIWSERVRDTAIPWSDWELRFGAELRDIFRSFISTARLTQSALHDPLTGLANRLLFERRLQQEVRNSMERNGSFAVQMIDLDKFKEVNDTLGHRAGDLVLMEVAARLMNLMRREDTVARLGGDEFAVLQTALQDRTSAVSTAEKIVRSISEPIQIGGQTVQIGASVGISISSDTVEEAELLECADLALYQVKRSGRNSYSMYAPGMKMAKSLGSDAGLVMQAIRNNEFGLKYQPIVDAKSGELRGFEAFLHWRRPGGTEAPASEFIPMWEKKRWVASIGEWVLDAVFSQYHQWVAAGLAPVPITINVGTAEFTAPDLASRIAKLADSYKTGCQWLRLDIKEEALLIDVAHAIRKLHSLRDEGVGANLDNFGRGFVPLGYLTQLPFQGIKLDGILFADRSNRQGFEAMFNVVQSVAQVLNAQLTVTKIETREMRETLKKARVDLLQGYAIARPLEADQAAEWLRHPEASLR